MINLNATLIIQLVNVLILMFLLNRILFRPTMRLLDERRQRTEGRKQLAAKKTAEAQAIWDDYQKRLHAAKAEADRVRTDLVKQAEQERQKLLDETAAQAEKTVAEVRARLRGEAETARKALQADAARLADVAAERILGRTV